MVPSHCVITMARKELVEEDKSLENVEVEGGYQDTHRASASCLAV